MVRNGVRQRGVILLDGTELLSRICSRVMCPAGHRQARVSRIHDPGSSIHEAESSIHINHPPTIQNPAQ